MGVWLHRRFVLASFAAFFVFCLLALEPFSQVRVVAAQASTPPRGEPSLSAGRVGAQVTWSGQIAPILYGNCTTCHHPGGAGPFSLVGYENARRWAKQMVTVTQSRYMPPWLPEPGYGDFADSRRLSNEHLALIKKWVAAGMPQGDPTRAPVPPAYSSTWTMGKPDLVLTVEQPFSLAAGGQDVFRNFILPYRLDTTHSVRAMEILPGVASIVHHANVVIDRTAQFRHQHAADWRQGVPGMELVVDAGKSFDPDGHFLFWKPDTPAIVEPDGMPWHLDPGNDLILNMHLKPSGKAETIQPQIGIYFTDKPAVLRPMLLQLDRDDALDIPADQSKFTVEDEMTLPVDVQLLGIYPHAHYLGKDMKSWAILPGGKKEWLVWIRDWDIDRQSVYRFQKPVSLPRGTTVHMRYIYDNSASNPRNPHTPAVAVRAGNRSEDEMAHLWLQVLPVIPQKAGAPDPRLLLEEAWMRSRLRKIPGDYISLYNLGAALAEEGKTRESGEIFRQIVRERPADSRSWNALGATRESMGDWQEARESYTRAITVDEHNCDAEFNLAQIDLNHDLSDAAEAAFRAYVASCSDDAEARNGLGVVLLGRQQYEAAQREFLNALNLHPSPSTEAELRKHLAFLDAQTGKLGASIGELRAAVKLAPEDASVHALLAQVLAQAGQLPEAIAEQKAALLLHDEDADGWNNLGVFEARSGDTEAARSAFEQARRIDPNNAQAQVNLARLPVN